MKILLDENLSYRLAAFMPWAEEVIHLLDYNKTAVSDSEVWEFAKNTGSIIMTKDNDFIIRSQLYGHPPKVIFLYIGNCSNKDLLVKIQQNRFLIEKFATNEFPLLRIS